MAVFAYSSPILAGNTLPDPSEIEVKTEFIGGSETMWDGRTIHDLVNPSPKRTFTYRWAYVDDVTAIQAGWAAAKSESVSLVHIDGQTYTVARGRSAKDLTYKHIKVAAGIAAVDVQLVLVEQ